MPHFVPHKGGTAMKQLCAILFATLLAATSIATARHYHHYRHHHGFRVGTTAALHFQNKFNVDY
jgi:hypothetical protein